MDLPRISDLDVSGKRVLVRLDLDLPEGDFTRLEVAGETLDYLKSKNAQIVVIGHRGRPGGVYDQSLSLNPFQKFFDKWEAKVEENLRFDPGEEKNDPEFAKKLAELGDVYVNEAFGNSHRNHVSIVGLPKLLPHAAGFRFIAEVENLSKVFNPSAGSEPGRPVVVLLGGAKKDKLDYLEGIKKFADKILVGGRLPEYLEQDTRYSILDTKILVANLLPDKEDLAINSMEKFEEEIAKAGTIVLAGPMGKYEDEGHRQGTERIFKAVVSSKAFRVAGGGDTEAALTMFNLTNKFDWVSVGGGAMLEFLAKGTLPGIQALLECANVNVERR